MSDWLDAGTASPIGVPRPARTPHLIDGRVPERCGGNRRSVARIRFDLVRAHGTRLPDCSLDEGLCHAFCRDAQAGTKTQRIVHVGASETRGIARDWAKRA